MILDFSIVRPSIYYLTPSIYLYANDCDAFGYEQLFCLG
jgi:hypothetical protein